MRPRGFSRRLSQTQESNFYSFTSSGPPHFHVWAFAFTNVYLETRQTMIDIFAFRAPEPYPPPVKEPPDSPENPDVPVREPDPDEPSQI